MVASRSGSGVLVSVGFGPLAPRSPRTGHGRALLNRCNGPLRRHNHGLLSPASQMGPFCIRSYYTVRGLGSRTPLLTPVRSRENPYSSCVSIASAHRVHHPTRGRRAEAEQVEPCFAHELISLKQDVSLVVRRKLHSSCEGTQLVL